jgi:microcystin-dependent protein
MATITVTRSQTFVSGDTVTPENLNVLGLPAVTATIDTDEVVTAKILDLNVTAAKLAATLDLSAKTVTLPDLSVTPAKLAQTLDLTSKTLVYPGGSIVPTGGVIMWTSATLPSGWLLCDGSAYARTGTYAALYAVIGTTFGAGNGTTTFNVPNTSGRFVRGVGTDASNAGNGTTLGAYQGHALQDHKHEVPLGSNGNNNDQPQVLGASTESANDVDTSLVNATTANVANETRPANLGLSFIIKY